MSPSSLSSRRRLIPFALLVALALGGCFRVETTIEIGGDATADLALSFLVDVATLSEFAEEMGGAEALGGLEGLSGEDLIREMLDGDDPCALNLPDGIGEPTVTEVEDGDYRGVRCTVVDVALADLQGADDGASFDIVQNDDGTEVEIRLQGVDELFSDADQELPPGFDMAMDSLLDIRYVVSAPGTLLEHNGTSATGDRVTWIITPGAEFAQNGTAVMTARWSAAGDSGSAGDGNTGLIVLIVVIIAAAAGIAGLLIGRSRRSSAPPTATASGSTAPGSSPLPPPPPPASQNGPQPGSEA